MHPSHEFLYMDPYTHSHVHPALLTLVRLEAQRTCLRKVIVGLLFLLTSLYFSMQASDYQARWLNGSKKPTP